MSETTSTISAPKEKLDRKTKRQPPYNVILLDDKYHTVDYVVAMCQKVFGYVAEKGILIAKEVHEQERAILWTGSLELAELKREQIHSLGKDPQVKNCKGSMTVVLEPAS